MWSLLLMLLESRFLWSCFSNIICKESFFVYIFMVKIDYMINIKKWGIMNLNLENLNLIVLF